MPRVQRELFLSQFASDDDLRQETDPHPREHTLFDGFYAGELRDVLWPYIGRCQLQVQLFALSAVSLSQQQSLIDKIFRIHLPGAAERMIRRTKEVNVCRQVIAGYRRIASGSAAAYVVEVRAVG
jgi:hypothetical protein